MEAPNVRRHLSGHVLGRLLEPLFERAHIALVEDSAILAYECAKLRGVHVAGTGALLVTLCSAAATYATLALLMPAIEMRPSRVR